MKSKYIKTIPEKVYRDDIVFIECDNQLIPFKVLRKSPNSLLLKNKEKGLKRAFGVRKNIDIK